MQNIVDIIKNAMYTLHCKGDGSMAKNEKMKQCRKAAGMSQTDLAKAADVTRQTIGLIESGEFNPSISLCIRICRALNVTLNDLFWEEENDE